MEPADGYYLYWEHNDTHIIEYTNSGKYAYDKRVGCWAIINNIPDVDQINISKFNEYDRWLRDKMVHIMGIR